MNLAALRLLLLALPLAACSQTEPPPVPAFETVTIDFREQTSQLVPLPSRKPGVSATAPAGLRRSAAVAGLAAPGKQHIVSPVPVGPDEPSGASSQTVASSQYASVTRYFKRWLPDFNKITDCPDGITCHAAFAN